MRANRTKELTHFVFQFMVDSRPAYSDFQTEVVVRNLKENPEVGEALLQTNLLPLYNRERVIEL